MTLFRKNFGENEEPITLKEYLEKEGLNGEVLKSYTVLLNGKKCSPADLSKMIQPDDEIIIMPILRGGSKS